MKPGATTSDLTSRGPLSANGILLVIPLLLLLTGGGILAISQAMMRSAAEQAATARFSRMTADTAHRLDVSLGQAAPLLDGLHVLMETGQDLTNHERMARALYARVRGRPGIAFLSISLDDGTFLGVERMRDGSWSYQHSQTQADGRSPLSRWTLGEDGTPGAVTIDPEHRYDPRTRSFYRLAMVNGKRGWTEPYAFFGTGSTGISCVEPFARAGAAPHAVLTADFDLDSLDSTLGTVVNPQATAVLAFTADRTLLAAPQAWRSGRQLPKDRLLRSDDLGDSLAAFYFANLPPLPDAARGNVSFRFPATGGEHLGVVTACPLPSGSVWYLGLVTPLSALLGDANRSLGWSLALGALMLALGGLAAIWFARHLAHSRSVAVDARQRARDAEARADDMGSYRLLKLLGRGGMGEVWRAEHRLLARPAAIKLITAGDVAHDPDLLAEAMRRFEQEARITASLRSRNTIEIYDFGVAADGRFFYAMELLDGMDLYELVAKHGPPPLGRIVHLLRQACASLAEAHDRGLVHRDIKAPNLYICRRVDEVDLLKVLDFGIARVLSPRADQHLTRQGLVQGTPTTMSPEQAVGDPLDGRSDLYSLGCVLHFLLTGEEVFDHPDTMAILLDHIKTPVVPLIQRTSRYIPIEVENLMLRLLTKRRDARTADARTLAVELEALAIPPEEAWDEARAQAWWAQHLPRRKLAEVPAPGEGARLVVGQRR